MSPRPVERLAFGGNGRREVAPVASRVPAARDARVEGPSGPTPAPPSAERAAARRAGQAEPRDWPYIWLLVFTAVIFVRPQDLFPLLEALHLAEASAVAALVSLISGRLRRQLPVTRMTPEFVGVIALGSVILLTAPFSIWSGGSVGVFTNLYSKVVLMYLLAVNVIDSPKRLERFTWILVLSVGYIAFRAVFDYARGVNLIARGTRVAGATNGIMGNSNDLALHMAVFFPLAAFFALRPAAPFKRLVAAFCLVCMMGAVVASGSRGGFVGFAAMLLALAVFAVRQRPAFVIAGILVTLCALPLVPSTYWRRISSIMDSSKDDYGTSASRKRLLGESFDAFVEHPFTGVGAGEFKDWNPKERREAWHESHNVFLQVAAELGIFGLAVFTFLVVESFRAIFQTRRLLKKLLPVRRRRGPPEPRPSSPISTDDASLLEAHSTAMIATLVGWVVCAQFASVAYNWTFYYLLALAATPREMLRAMVPSPRAARAVAATQPHALAQAREVGA